MSPDKFLDRDDPRCQAAFSLGRRLETCLRAISRIPKDRKPPPTFEQLIEEHRGRDTFSDFRGVQSARPVRNKISHEDPGASLPTLAEVERAHLTFERALEEVLPRCPQSVQDQVKPDPMKHENLSAAGASTLPGAAPIAHTAQPSAEPPQNGTPPPPKPAGDAGPRGAPEAPTKLRPRPGANKDWAIFVSVAVIAAVAVPVAYFATHRQTPLVIAKVKEKEDPPPKKTPSREEVFLGLINGDLTISTTRPNVAVVIDSSGSTGTRSVAEALQGFLGNDGQAQLIGNIADMDALKVGGFFEDLYAGNGQFLKAAAQKSHIDYMLLGKAAISFRRQPDIDPTLITCDLTLSAKLADHAGTIVRSGSFTVAGPGFTEDQALQQATENLALQVKQKLLDTIL
jgi:hypothetical protein